jgi:hypothetical protein
VKTTRRTALKGTAASLGALTLQRTPLAAQEAAQPFGSEFPALESLTTGEWWTKSSTPKSAPKNNKPKGSPPAPPPPMDVPRDQITSSTRVAGSRALAGRG